MDENFIKSTLKKKASEAQRKKNDTFYFLILLYLMKSLFLILNTKRPMKKIFLFLFLFSSLEQFSQGFKICASYEVIKEQDRLHPGYKAMVDASFTAVKAMADANRGSRAVNAADTIYHIPIVVHVVRLATEDNIPDSLIYSQIEVLNRDFNHRNEDSIQTRNAFKPLMGRLNFDFFLATTDPLGNPSTGIIRKLGAPAISFFGFNAFSDNVKDPVEGDAPWPTDKYLNVWVCNLNTIPLGLLGYAYPPTGAANWDAGSYIDSAQQGVVIDYTAFGRNNPYIIDPGIAPGRTAVHEFGHYFGLRHIWADEAACVEDDGISDTPAQGDQTNFDCDTSKNSCTDIGTDYPDMIENYMDYSNEFCQNMFTKEQADIMFYNLQMLRPNLAQKTVVYGVGITKSDFDFISVSIYPNPAKEILYLDLNFSKEKNIQFTIIDQLGRQIKTQTINQVLNKIEKIDISGMSSGIYFINVSDGNHLIHQKIIKN